MTDIVFWHQAVFAVPAQHVEQAESVLYDLGALSVTLQDAGEQPLLEPAPGAAPLGSLSVRTGLFAQDKDLDGRQQKLQLARGELVVAGFFDISRVDNQEWERAWMQDYGPMHFGRRLSIY